MICLPKNRLMGKKFVNHNFFVVRFYPLGTQPNLITGKIIFYIRKIYFDISRIRLVVLIN